VTTKEFCVEVARLGRTTKDGTRLIHIDAQVSLRPGSCVMHIPYGMPEAASVVAELTKAEVVTSYLCLYGYGLPGIAQALEERKAVISFMADDLVSEPVPLLPYIVMTSLRIVGGVLVPVAEYAWEGEV
jgi:hypothetical protein